MAGNAGTGTDPRALNDIVRRLGPRWFLMRDASARSEPVLLHPRTAMSLLRGPMTRTELQTALALERELRGRP